MDCTTPGVLGLRMHVVPVDEDHNLIQAFLAGDRAAFSRLVGKYRKQVYALAYRYTRNHEEADDIAQETFIIAYEKLSAFRGESSFKTWLLRITSNLSINLQKSGRIAKDIGAAPEVEDAQCGPTGLANVLTNERNRILMNAIDQLPPKQKRALILKTFQELSCEEVAKIMECSVGTVKANVFNALKKLRTLLV